MTDEARPSGDAEGEELEQAELSQDTLEDLDAPQGDAVRGGATGTFSRGCSDRSECCF